MADPSNENEEVFSSPTLMLGEIHWHLLRASQLMYEKTIVKTKGEGFVIREGYTDFGREVGRDEINWWVSRQEPDIGELRDQATRALEAAQRLKKASERLKVNKPETYSDLLKILRQFAEDHSAEINSLHQFVLWLALRDILAPKTLFTYRVWGSTRMSDREAQLDPGEREPRAATVKWLTEIVLGLTTPSGIPISIRAEYEIGGEMWERGEFDEDTGSIRVPTSRIVRRASFMAFAECAEYFEFIRDSLRNVLLDVEKFIEQRAFVNDDAFWRAFIEKVTRAPKVESQLWDCKETLTMWRVDKNPERDQAKVIFSEDVASFANAGGGVLVIGVTDKREVVGIGNGHELENKLKFAADVLSKQLDYPREITRLRQIVVQGNGGTDKICLVVVIAQACEPVGVHDGAGHYTYPIRRETHYKRAPLSS